MIFYNNFTSLIENPLLLVWNDSLEIPKNQEQFLFGLYKICKHELNMEIFSELIKIPYTIGINQIASPSFHNFPVFPDSPDSPIKSKRFFQENISTDIYTKQIKEIEGIILNSLIITIINQLCKGDQALLLNLSNFNPKNSHMDIYVELTSLEINDELLSKKVFFMKKTVTGISKFLKELKESIMSMDLRETQFLEDNFTIIKSCFNSASQPVIFKETRFSNIQGIENFISTANAYDILSIINCITYDKLEEQSISFKFLFKWIESSWLPYSKFILRFLSKKNTESPEAEKKYLIWKLKNCDVVREYENYGKWNSLPRSKFEEFCLLWIFAVRNKHQIIEKYEHLIKDVYQKILDFNDPTDEEINSFFYFLFTILSSSSSELYCNIGEYIDRVVDKIRTSIIKIILKLKDECVFNEKEFIQSLDCIFPICNMKVLLKIFTIKEGFGGNFISHYLERHLQLSEDEYRQRVKYALDILEEYICHYRKYLDIAILDNLYEKVKIENFWNDNLYKDILKRLTQIQIESGSYSQSFLDKYFENLTLQNQDSIDFKGWTDNFKILFIYMFFSKTIEEKQRKQQLIFEYINRFASDILIFISNVDINQIFSILKLSCGLIPNLQQSLSETFKRIINESIQVPYLNWQKGTGKLIDLHGEILELNFDEPCILIPDMIKHVFNRIISYLDFSFSDSEDI
ncbi:unnamed protein product [Blepharisma stoltei]|uniref:Uncharacterized protein n=1 Tax=Blepharisma stoltei TaxID=1481888 RepID=A0AAU9J406_9CILI|nr:unnamed protein product [Blepharisma stoltei]